MVASGDPYTSALKVDIHKSCGLDGIHCTKNVHFSVGTGSKASFPVLILFRRCQEI